jgi:diaminopimelate epimerase
VKSFNFNGALADLNAMDAACVTVFAKDLELLKSSTNIEINGQIVCCIPISSHENMNVVSVRILEPLSAKKSVQSFVMDFGETPYCMVPTNDVSHTDVLEKGREISYKKRFPKGANVTFYQPNPGFLEIRHYEHQVDQETYTNGLCVIGAALSHAQNNPGDSCLVRAKGGEMQVSFARSDEAFYNVELRVLVNAIYEGKTV